MSDSLAALRKKVSILSSDQRNTISGIDLLCKLAWEEGVLNSEQLKRLSEETLANSRQIQYQLGKARSLRNLAYWALVFGNDAKGSAALAQEAVYLAEICQNDQAMAELFDILAMCFTYLGSFERSLEYTRKSMGLFQKTGDQRGLAWSHRNLGELYKDATDFEQAESHYQQALTIFEQIEHYNGMARVYNNIGRLYTDLKDYKTALEYQLKSLKADEKTGLQGLGYSGTLLYIGMINNRMGDTEQALQYLKKSKQLLEELFPDQPEQNLNYAAVLLEMGLSHQKQNLLDQAIVYFKQSIQASEISENKEQEYQAYKSISECYDSLKKYHTALEHYRKYTLLQQQVLIGENNLKLDNMNMSQEIVLAELEKDTQRRLKEETEKILLRILPKKVMEELRDTGGVQPQHFEQTTVLFSDFVGFTQISKTMSAEQLVTELDYCFSEFDKIIQSYGLERMKTIGDGYMAVAGVPIRLEHYAVRSVLVALELSHFINALKQQRESQNQEFWNLRIGLNSGPLIAGIIGHSKFAYDVWGETVNVASRMESYGQSGSVNISESTYQLIKDFFDCESRGKIEVKHQQRFTMYLVKNVKSEYDNEAWKSQFYLKTN